MKPQNIQAFQRLSAFCRYSGIMSIFLGMLVVFLDVVNKDWIHMQVGLFIFASGYALFRTGKRISAILFDERTEVR